MTTVNPERALAEYQRRTGALMNEVVMRDVAIAELEEAKGALEERLRSLEAEATGLRHHVVELSQKLEIEGEPVQGSS